jgi:lysyl-tRNA synthetase class 2
VTQEQQPEELNEHRRVRLEKLLELERRGVDPFPTRVERTHSAAEALAAFVDVADESARPVVAVAGRIVSELRRMGGLVFCHLADSSGRVQLAFKIDVLGPERFDQLELIDRADFLEARGPLFRTRRGEITVEVHDYRVIAKALRPLPEKWHGLTDVEKRYRQRYLDLVVNEEARRTLVTRSKVVAALRRFLDARGFLDAETPILQPLYGGAAARPFQTYHNALDRRLYLRIAIELYLKRLIIGGLDRVYEIGRNFRNEGIDRTHNPEFTMLEIYQAYADYQQIMALAEEMIATVAAEVLGTTKVTFKGQEVELRPPWRRVPLLEAIYEYSRVDVERHPTRDGLAEAACDAGLPVGPDWSRGKILDELVSTRVEPNLVQPTFLVDYPVEFPGSTLAKRQPGRGGIVERFEGYAGGFELCNAFTELNDPRDQRARFEEQAAAMRGGDEEAHPLDEDFLIALEHGMPPTGGIGVGIDRLTMFLTDQPSIREVIFFPQLRTIEE